MPEIIHDPNNDVRASAGERERPDDENFMWLAVEQARIGDRTCGGGEVGCVIVRDGEVLVAAHNEVDLRYDPTAHAEIVALRRLGEKLNQVEFRGCTLYCTLQPCSMCTAACIWAKIGRIVYGATRNDVHSMYFDEKHFNTADLVADAFREDLEIVAGLLAEECSKFYYKPGEDPPAEEQTNT
jgi:tRNA(adenine34) deaminase